MRSVCRVREVRTRHTDRLVLGVELDDELLGEDRVDLLTDGQLVDEHGQRAVDDLHPRRGRAVTEGLASQLERERLDLSLIHI